VPNFLCFVDDSGKEALLFGQWRSSLIIRWPLPGYDFREKWGEIGAKDALTKDVRKLITVAADDKGTAIYLDGRRARVFPNLNLNDLVHGIMDRAFVLGNSPSGNSSWSGDVFGLAFYTGTINEEEARESFRQWVSGEKKGHAPDKRLRGLYLFDEGEGKQVQNAVEGAGPLLIPEHLKFQREVLSRPVINDHNKLAYIEDAVINILGFVPLGFCLTAGSRKREDGTRPMHFFS
jgi:hypothetical protein